MMCFYLNVQFQGQRVKRNARVHLGSSSAEEAAPLSMTIVPLTDLTVLESENFAVNYVPDFKVYT